jgi:aldose 1-epimerase
MEHSIVLQSGPMRATILARGATLARLQQDGRDLILGFETPDAQTARSVFAGVLVGPIANRIAAGQLLVAGTSYQMQCNEHGLTSLHSGDDGIHALTWSVLEQSENNVLLSVMLPDGHAGLPGKRAITVRYTLGDDVLTLEITAVSDRETPMNIAHHPYWALGDGADAMTLQINADRYLEKDALGVSTGRSVSVDGTQMDFRTPKNVKQSNDIDHCFCLSTSKQDTPRHVATLSGPDGHRVEIDTTEPGLHVYDGSGLPDEPEGGAIPFRLKPYGAVALEPQGWPDAPNHPDFPSIMIHPDAPYRQITRYRFCNQARS